MGLDQPDAFIPLEYSPGQDAQCDFGEAQVSIAGQRLTAQYPVPRLCYSTLPFVMAFPHQRQEAFFEGHVAAFDFLGGAPRRSWYDNLTQAVQRVLAGHNRQEQQAFTTPPPKRCQKVPFGAIARERSWSFQAAVWPAILRPLP